jgi:hypothetical protein
METSAERRHRRLLWLIEQEGGLDPMAGRRGGHYVIAERVCIFEQSDKEPSEVGQYLRQIAKAQGSKNLTDKMARRIEAAYESENRLGVRKGWFDSPSTDEIATAIAGSPMFVGTSTNDGLLTNIRFAPQDRQPGLVYSWDEVVRMFRAGVEEHLPDVFSVELMDDALPGRARKGDIVTLSRKKVGTVEAGDGIMVKTANDSYMLRVYRPKGDGTWLAEATNPNFMSLHNVEDGLTILAVVVGVPSCRWSSL